VFLNIPQIEELKGKLEGFVRQVVSKVRKPMEQLYYAYEPKAKTIHIVNGEEMFTKVLATMAEQKRKLGKFPNGKYFRPIPRRIVFFGLKVNPDEYTKVQCWGTQKKLEFQAYFGKGHLYFRVGKATGSVTDGIAEIDMPDLKEGRRWSSREDQVRTIFSDLGIDAMLDALAIDIDPELKRDIRFKIKEAG
jgi:hypothetical protein